MSELAIPTSDDVIRSADTDTLKQILAEAFKWTAVYLNYLAKVWAELSRRGEDMSALRSDMGYYLGRIAAGKLAAEAVVTFAGQPARLRKMYALSPAEQVEVVEGKRPPPWADATPKKNRTTGTSRPRVVSPKGGDEADLDDPGPTVSSPNPMERAVHSAAKASPRDLVQLVVRMVEANENSRTVAGLLIEAMKPIQAGHKRRQTSDD